MDAEQEAYVQELEEILKDAKHPKVRKLLQKAIDDVRLQVYKAEATVVKAEKTSAKGKLDTAGMVKITTYGWDDAGKVVKLYITSLPGIEELKGENVEVDFKEKGLNLTVYNLKGKNYCLVFHDFFEHIVPSESSFKVGKGMITVSLKKAKSTSKWACLTATEKRLKAAREYVM
jgi:hypothetical protein